jgi:hypothetical protein
MSAEMFLVVMLARQTPRAHASGHDLKRSAGTEENRLNSFAARLVCQVRKWRPHGCVPIRGKLRAGFRPPSQNSDSHLAGFPPKKMRRDRL